MGHDLIGRALVGVLAGLSAGCTFAGIGSYEVALCAPNPVDQSSDDCERLNHADSSGCAPWQCDAASRRCVQRPRDDDRDGDPSARCGGGDCDDHDSQISSRHVEVCDGKDNDCNGQVDDGVVSAGPSSKLVSLGVLSAWSDPWFGGASGRDLLATWVTASHCVQAVRLAPGGGYLAPECAFAADKTLSPRQPEAAVLGAGAGAGAVMVTTSGGCSAVRYSDGGGVWAQDCAGAAPGAALPAVAAFSAAQTVLVAWYAVDPAARESAIQSCEAAGAAELRAVVLGGSGSALHPIAPPAVLLSGGTSVRPAALVAVGEAMLAAAPSSDGIAVASVKLSRGVVGAPAPIGNAQGARAVVMAAAPDGIHLAVAAELGCTPQSIGVAFGRWDAVGQTARFADLVEAAPRGRGVSVQPSVTWIDARREWLVTFIADGPVGRARRFAADGTPIGEAFDLGAARQVVAAADGHVYALVDGTESQIVQMPVACHQGEQK